jgi:hypothetical protein
MLFIFYIYFFYYFRLNDDALEKKYILWNK